MDGWTVLIAAHAAGATLAVLLGGLRCVCARGLPPYSIDANGRATCAHFSRSGMRISTF